MRGALLVIGVLLAACAQHPVAQSSSVAHDMNCGDAEIAFKMPGTYKCQKFDEVIGTINDQPGRGLFERHNLYGDTDDHLFVSIQIFKSSPLDGGYVSFADNLAGIQEFSSTTQNGRDWSALRRLDQLRVADFTGASGAACAGFFELGDANRAGYGSLLRGVMCRFGPRFSNDELTKLIGNISIR